MALSALPMELAAGARRSLRIPHHGWAEFTGGRHLNQRIRNGLTLNSAFLLEFHKAMKGGLLVIQ